MKEISESPVYVMGQPLKFDIMATQDTLLISELDKCVKRGVGGILTLTEAQYNEELSKKNSSTPSPDSLSPTHRKQVLSALHLNVRPAAAGPIRQVQPGASQVTGRMPEPIEVPSPSSFGLPPLGRTVDVNKK